MDIVAGGRPAPPAQAIAEVTEPHNTLATAQRLPLSAVVEGTVTTADPGPVVYRTGASAEKIEDLYRLDVPEDSILTLLLEPKDREDLALYVFSGMLGGNRLTNAALIDFSDSGDANVPEALQLRVGPGFYYIGASAWDGPNGANVKNGVPVPYTLSVTTTPMTPAPVLPRPVLDQLVVGNITATAAEARWLTDRDASADLLAAGPLQQFGDPAASRSHRIALNGLAAGAAVKLTAVSQVSGGDRSNLPPVYFRSASPTAAVGPPKISATALGAVTDGGSVLVAIVIQNSGGPATDVKVSGLTASKGWKLAQPLTGALTVGSMGSGSAATVMLRLLRDGTGPSPLATVTGSGTLAGAAGAVQKFEIGP